MAEISADTRRMIGVLINRKGKVEYVMVGDAKQIEMPDFKRVRVAHDRLRGLRCLITRFGDEQLTQDDLTDLALLRFDMMSVISVDRETGLPGNVYSAHLAPQNSPATANGNLTLPYMFLEPNVPSQVNTDFAELMQSLESELAGTVKRTAKKKKSDRVILVTVTTKPRYVAEESMQELVELAESADVTVLDTVIQRRRNIDPKTVLGKGKLNELLIRAMQLGADMIVFDGALTPGQVRAISEATEFKVVDRPQLILDIFAQRATSREGKLQVELAQLKYLLPRLGSKRSDAFSRLAGGIGGRGPGETKLETDRRRVRKRISDLNTQVKRLRKQRQVRRKSRLQKKLPIVSLVGYTNAGKSTLLNALTKSKVHAEKRMFATLDPSARKLRLPYEQEVILNDTVGFIRDLPEALVEAFRATLEEISDSDLLLHIVDASGDRAEQQIESVVKILTELELNEIPSLVILNKADAASKERLEQLTRLVEMDFNTGAIQISALNPATFDRMIDGIGKLLARDLKEFAA